MKFIWYTIASVILIGAIIAYELIAPHPAEEEVAITVNSKHISSKAFKDKFALIQKTAHNSDQQDFINSLIVKELMIQEAQKEGIDKDESFRRSIQDYYEQSLVKQIIDKKVKNIHLNVSDYEIDHFVTFQNSTVKFTTLSADNENAAKKGQFKAQETKTFKVNDLSCDVAERLEALKEAGGTTPLCSDSGREILRLDKVTSPAPEKLTDEKRSKLRAMLLERKQQRAMESWVSELRSRAKIEISIK